MSKMCKRGHISSTLPGGRNKGRSCNECLERPEIRKRAIERAAKWNRDNLDRRRVISRKSARKAYAMNSEKFLERDRKANECDPRCRLLYNAKQRAKRAGLPFNLTLDDIVIPTHCPALGIPLMPAKHNKPRAGSPSLDKIIPELGYVRGNVCIISNKANAVKSDLNPEQLGRLLNWLRAVYPTWLLLD